jgi:hypothetical protein
MSQVIVQQSAEVTVSSGSTGNVTLNGVGAGNILTVQGTNETNANNFSTPTDNNGNTWAAPVQAGNNSVGMSCLSLAQNANGGNTTVTLGLASGTATYRFRVIEWSGSLTTGQPDASDHQIEAAGTTHHESSAGINPTGACVVLCAASLSNLTGGATAGGGYSSFGTASNYAFYQYQIYASAPSNEKGAWTSVNSIAIAGSIIAFKAAAGAAPTYVPPSPKFIYVDEESGEILAA